MRNYLLYILPLILLAMHTNSHPCGQRFLYNESQEVYESKQNEQRKKALAIAVIYQLEFPHESARHKMIERLGLKADARTKGESTPV